MTRLVLAAWLVCVVLAAAHLMPLGVYHFSVEVCVVMAVVLAWYSLPFALLGQMRLRQGAWKDALAIGLLVAVVALDCFTSLRRFLPGYRPEALESIIYLVVPAVECLPVGAALVVLL